MKPETAKLLYEAWLLKLNGRQPTSNEATIIERYRNIAEGLPYIGYTPSNNGDTDDDI